MSILIRCSRKRCPIRSTAAFVQTAFNACRNVSRDKKPEAKGVSGLQLQNLKHYDVIITGGGLVGTSLACAISKTKVLQEKTVLLLESAPEFKGFTGGQYRNRVSAINNGSIELFKTLDAWDKISSTRCKSVKQMQVWDGSSDALITFNHDDFNENVACIIENDLILDSIYSQLKLSSNVTVLNQSVVSDVELRKDGKRRNIVSLKNGDLMTCDLLNPGIVCRPIEEESVLK